MFSALRQNSPLYILDKRGVPRLIKGSVVSVTSQKSRSGMMYGNPMDMVVDMTVTTPDGNEQFNGVPASLSIANDGNMTLSETMDDLCKEVEDIMRTNRQMLDSMDYNRQSLEACEGILAEISPQFAKERQNDEKVLSLERKMSGMEETLQNIQGMLSKALAMN